jgi:hypothetical protein
MKFFDCWGVSSVASPHVLSVYYSRTSVSQIFRHTCCSNVSPAVRSDWGTSTGRDQELWQRVAGFLILSVTSSASVISFLECTVSCQVGSRMVCEPDSTMDSVYVAYDKL